MGSEGNILNLKTKVPPLLFELIVSEISSTHVNFAKDCFFNKKNPYECILFFFKNLFFCLAFLRKISFKNVTDNEFSSNIVYYGNEKTKTEKIFLSDYFNIIDKKVVSISNDESVDMKSLNQMSFTYKYLPDYIKDVSKILVTIFYVGITRKVKLNEFFVLSLALKNIGVHYKWKSIIDIYEPDFIVNFFSATTEGHALNFQAQSLNKKVFTYSWGSNIKAIEQKFTVQDYVLLKSQDEIGKYRYGEEVVIGDLGLRRIERNLEQVNYICLIDTCYNDKFRLFEKSEMYRKIFKWLDTINVKKVHVVFHPGSVDTDTVMDLAKDFTFTFSMSIGDLDFVLSKSKLAINIVSTELKTVIYSGIPVVNFAPLYFDMYLPNSKCEGFLNRSSGVDIHFWSQLDEYYNLSDVINSGFNEEEYSTFVSDYVCDEYKLNKFGRLLL
ncbi:hypothetical protein C9J12_02920 [Photobacterium frigidiphilum]|uniref:Uncharacterized protein n=1 Tax=Photobacterium frigidiphilum TaxID=264736 RepID=A0A2T3JPF8_9GAMM|nr:hypothetical protein [Photobacterium frigidiphilum]PSU50935.1 hypothetical protein C9J12_02920 [Photobacterium frigidiphilum]